MTSVLNSADAVYLGASKDDALYAGTIKAWPPQFPGTLPGLAIWFDASQLYADDGAPVSPWPNLANPAMPGAIYAPVDPSPPTVRANALNGLPVVHFLPNQGSVVMDATGVDLDYTCAFVARMVNGADRIISGDVNVANFLLGWVAGNQDSAYCFGYFDTEQTPWTTDWKLYSSDSDGVEIQPTLYSDGVPIGQTLDDPGAIPYCWRGTLVISGLGFDDGEQTSDCEVAEFILYDRKLPDGDRQAVEDYLRQKWLTPKVIGVPPPDPLDPATRAYLNVTGLDDAYAPALDSLVTGLKANGLWSKMAAVYPMIGGTAELHQWNLIDPRDADDAYRLTFNGGTHSLDLGYRPNEQDAEARGAYGDTHLIPLGLLDQDSTHLSYYSLLDVPPGDRTEIGCFDWGTSGGRERFHIIACYVNYQFYFDMATSGTSNCQVPAASGLFVTTRTDATDQAAYRNGSRVGGNGISSIPLPNVSVWVGGIDTYIGRSDLPCGFASIGSGLTDQNVADLYAVVQVYQAALGRQTAP